jgi:DNA-binding response OmpR family regulator
MPIRLVESIKQRPLRVAILNPDAELETMSRTLAGAGLCCEDFSDGLEFVRALSQQCFDLAVLGRGGWSRDGRHVLRLMRRCLNDDIPVLFACPVSDEQYVTSILQAGADVYLNMPASGAVILARTGALLRRVNPAPVKSEQIVIGDLRFDEVARQILRNGEPIRFTSREFELALLLFRHIGRPLTRAHILERLWKQVGDVSSRTLDTHISQLRTKLNPRPQNGFQLKPIYGVGYQLDLVSGATHARAA